jgi:hypothetical protein
MLPLRALPCGTLLPALGREFPPVYHAILVAEIGTDVAHRLNRSVDAGFHQSSPKILLFCDADGHASVYAMGIASKPHKLKRRMNMATRIETTHDAQTRQPGSVKSLLWASLLAMTASSAANVALYTAVGLLVPSVTAWPGAGPEQIIGATIVYLLIGTVVCALLARYSSRPRRHFWTLATAGLVLSLWLPLGAALGYGAPNVPAPNTATAITLGLMHVVSYIISVPLYMKFLSRNHRA